MADVSGNIILLKHDRVYTEQPISVKGDFCYDYYLYGDYYWLVYGRFQFTAFIKI